MKTPFTKAYIRRVSGTAEFTAFRKEFKQAVEEIAATIPRFQAINTYCGAYVLPSMDRAQFTVGKRKMGARDLEGNVISEKGTTLLYTLGPLGDIVCVLYPCQSDIAEVQESIVFLKIGDLTCHQLRRRLRRDLIDLVAYTYVTSCEAEATGRERRRIWWLRLMRTKTVAGEMAPSLKDRTFGSAILFSWKTFVSGLWNGMARPIGLIIVVWFLTRYAPHLVSLVTHDALK